MAQRALLVFGRMQPPTAGHAYLLTYAAEQAIKRKADVILFLSQSQDNKNPLKVSERQAIIRQNFPSIKFGPSSVTNPDKAISWAWEQGYSDIALLAGEDRKSSYERLTANWTRGVQKAGLDNLPKLGVVTISRVGLTKASTKDISGTQVRALAQQGNFKAFKRAMMPNVDDALLTRTMDIIKRRLGPLQESSRKSFRTWITEDGGSVDHDEITTVVPKTMVSAPAPDDPEQAKLVIHPKHQLKSSLKKKAKFAKKCS